MDGIIQPKSFENANIFNTFYAELAGEILEKMLEAPNKFTSKTTKITKLGRHATN